MMISNVLFGAEERDYGKLQTKKIKHEKTGILSHLKNKTVTVPYVYENNKSSYTHKAKRGIKNIQ